MRTPTPLALSLYTLLVVVAFMIAAPVAITFGVLVNQAWIFECDAKGYAPDNFLAYCTHSRFADYEHAAYLRDLEPEAVDAVKAADILVLGNSRAQFAFSVPQVADYFARRHLKFYLLSFGDGETAAFPRMLITKYDLHPRVAIINMDYFFDDGLSVSAKEALQTGWKSNLTFDLKHRLQTLHAGICTRQAWACGHNKTLFRDRKTGVWSLQDYDDETPVPLPGADAMLEPADKAALLARAQAYIAWLESRGTCVILTGVPSPRYDRETAKELAKALKRPAVFPDVAGLNYFDTSHLTRSSAERYAPAMLKALGLALKSCRH